MPPSTTANATAKRRTSTQDPAPARGRGNKVAKHAHAGDAPTSHSAEEHPNSVAVTAGGDKENLNSRPVRARAGKGGRNEQLEEFLLHIRPDLNKDKQNTRQGQTSFPQNTPENEFAPQKGTRRASRKNPQMPTTTASSKDPQVRRPEIPEKPLGAPPVPSLHLSRTGPQLGIPLSAHQNRHTDQVPSEKSRAPAQPPLNHQSDTNSAHSNQNPLELGMGSAEALISSAATGREPSRYHFEQLRSLDGSGFDTNSTSSQTDFTDPFARHLGVHPHIAGYDTREESRYNNGNFYNNHPNALPGYQQNNSEALRHEQHGGSFYQNEFAMPGNITSGGINFSNTQAFLGNSFAQGIQLDIGDGSVDLDGPPFEPPENSQARDLFLPEPREYDSDDALSYCDKPREDRHESDHDDDDIEVDEASPSEDEAAAVAALRAASPRANVQRNDSIHDEDDHDQDTDADSDTDAVLRAHAEDVLQAHRQRNRAQKPPKSSHLKDSAARQASISQNMASPGEDNDNDSHSVNGEHEPDSVKKPRAMRNSKKTSSSGDNPESLGFYPPEWASVLGQAQQRWQRHLILGRENPFPVRGEHLHEARKILTDVISESLNDGQLLDDTYTRTRAMDVCVFAEHSTWRGALKTVAIPIVAAKYESLITIPYDYHGSQLKAWRLVQDKIKDAIEHTSFHINGTDENGRTNNFGHPAIPQILVEFFYTGDKCLAALFPDDFRQSVPVHAIALVVTTIANCLDEWVEYVHKRTTVQFLGRNYSETFDSIMTAINDVKDDPYHGAKFEANRKKWARMGMAKLEGNLQMEHRRVKVVLD